MNTTKTARFIVEMDFTGEFGVDIGVVREDIESGTYAGSQVTAVRTALFTSVEEQMDAHAEALRRYHDDRASEADTDMGHSAVVDDYGYSQTARDAFVSGYLYATDRPNARGKEVEQTRAALLPQPTPTPTAATDRIADQLIELLPPAVSHRLSETDLDAIAAAVLTTPQPTPSTEPSCTCGYGGVHEPMNPRCERNGYRWTEPPAPELG